MTTTCVYRFLGTVPPVGFPLLVDADESPGERQPRVMGQRIRTRVSHVQRSVLTDAKVVEALKSKLEEGHTLKEIQRWAESGELPVGDRNKIEKTISVARKLNDKSLLRSVLLPCERVLFLGIVCESQPPPPIGAQHGLNHARVVVEGRLGFLPAMLTTERTTEYEKTAYYDSQVLSGSIFVLGERVGDVINGQRILKKSGMILNMNSGAAA